VVADESFTEQNLSKKQIQDIFLNKKRFLNGQQILVMNYESNHPLRICFQKSILEKSVSSLEKYWRRAYYKGKKPPKVIKSVEMLLSFFQTVQPSIGYMDINDSKKRNMKVLYREKCKE